MVIALSAAPANFVPSFAGDNPPAPDSVSLPPQPDSNTPTKTALRDVTDTCKHFEKAVSGVIHEVSRHEEVEYMNPWFGDTGAGWMDPYYGYSMMYPVADDVNFSYEEDGPLLPPRKQWLDFYNGEIAQLAGMLQNDLAITTIPQTTLATVDWQVANDTMKTVNQHRAQLVTLCAATPVDPDAVTKLSQTLHQDVSGIEDICKRLITIADQSPKQKSASLNQ